MKWFNNIQSRIESLLPKDKLEHYFIMSLLMLPVSLVWHCWWLTILAAVFDATAKEFIDVRYRAKKWDWFDWIAGALAGVVQGIILI